MLVKPIKNGIAISLLLLSLFVCILAGCKQDEYTSPLPGTAELKLRATYSFDKNFQQNNFPLRLTSLKAIRSDGIRANIFADSKAIMRQRTPDIYNALGKDASDSSIVMGSYPLPPGDYLGFEMIIEPGDQVVLDGYRYITVDVPNEYKYNKTVSVTNKPFSIAESKLTSIVVTANLDSILRKLAYTFEYHPLSDDRTRTFYFISSIN
jgi:hypothetical protein